MKHKALVLLVVVVLLSGPLLPMNTLAGPPAPPALTTLEPGGFRDIAQDLRVNVVFVGYEPGSGPFNVDEAEFRSGLPSTYRPLYRYTMDSFYDLPPGFFGLTFNYTDYNVLFADSAFENAFFGYLGSIAKPKPLTSSQQDYNTQSARSLDVTSNAWIDAPSVEQWLADNTGPLLGVDTAQYTVFFINWWGRPDFQFHVYTKTDEPDPDTDYNFGEVRGSRKMIAWGGTTPDDEESGLGSLHRIWFYDLSAGPEYWTRNWDLDDADVNGDGALDYRMPPVWEYGNVTGYRPFNNLSGDLAKVLRYVAIDMLFTSSPGYKPAISPPELPRTIQVDLNVIQADPDVDGSEWIQPSLIAQELGELEPFNTVSVEISSIPFDSRLAQVFTCWGTDSSCYGNRLYRDAWGDLLLYFSDHLIQFLEGDADYEVPFFAFNLAEGMLDNGLLGYADDNWVDGTQSYVYGFDNPGYQELGYGFTTTVIHETGHHLGRPHPHDGYDYESNVDFGPRGDYYFAWSGDESNTIMSYIDLNWDFGQFDRDNMNRYMTAIYINESNAILEDIYSSPRAGEVASLLVSADDHAAQALLAYAAMDWAGAALKAQAAYGDVLAAADQIKVAVEPQSWQADYKAKGLSSMFIDSVNDHRSAP